MAECHPVGFQWVMEAKARGAKIFHIDPRFTRTSAVAHRHVPVRAGSDIVLLGALVNHVLSGGHDFREYVLNYTNAAAILREDFRDTEDLDGVFSGYDEDNREYDPTTWAYQEAGDESGDDEDGRSHEHGPGAAYEATPSQTGHAPARDETLEHPRCVYQVLKRHYARYTPELVEEMCGISAAGFAEIADAVVANSGRERTTAFVYSVGWTQHTVGAQYIRTAAILQLLLGNIGRPGGGILALRGHASIQGSTDIPTLFNLLPGYLPMPYAHEHEDLATYLERAAGDTGFWGNKRAYMVSLLKAWWGDAATADNDFCFDYLPRLTGDHGTYQTVSDQIAGKVKGYFLMGENPAVGSAGGRLQRQGLAATEWLVVRDLNLIESAEFWKNSPEVAAGETSPEQIGTEVFFLPAASHVEKEGSFTNTQRLLQWRHKAVEPPDDARSDLWFIYHLGLRVRERLAGSADPNDRPALDLTWDYPVEGPHDDPSADAVLREINGYDGRRKGPHRIRRAQGRRLDVLRLLDLRGLLCRRGQPDRAPQAGHRAVVGRARVGLGLAGEPPHPLQPRLGRSRGPAVERAQGLRLVGRGEQWTGHDVPDFEKTKPPSYVPPAGAKAQAAIGGTDPFIMQTDGKALAVRAQAVSSTARCRRTTSRRSRRPSTRSTASSANPTRQLYPRRDNRYHPAGSTRLPVRLHDLPADRAPHRGRDEPFPALPVGAAAGDVLRGLAGPRGRARARQRRLGHDHHGAGRDRGARAGHRPAAADAHPGPYRPPGRAALPLGRLGVVTGDSANDLLPIVLDANTHIQESKAATCDIRPGRRPQGAALRALVRRYRRLAGIPED